jgi:hypothetical protein
MNRALLAIAIIMAPTAVLATPVTRSATVYGGDPCPVAKGDEIVVCARLPESERYRIPKRLRGAGRPLVGESQAWGTKARTLDAVGRAVLPGSCSVNGSYGQSGCTQAAMAQWLDERRLLADEKAAREAALRR